MATITIERWFTIDKYDHGCSGRAYRSKLAAIKGDSWQVWTEERVRKMFNFGQGTMDDFRRFCKSNNCTAVTEEDLWTIAKPMGEEWRAEAEQFIKSTIDRCNW